MKLKLNLGCGRDIKKGYLNCDRVDLPGVDKLVNLEEKLPFEDSSVKEIILNHVIEHVKNWDEVLIKEFYRICVGGGSYKDKNPLF